jgi:serine/threonine protein phosphatase PrpC
VRAAISQTDDYTAGLTAAFEAADVEILQYLESASEDGKVLTGAGSTASVLLVDPSKVIVANVGDSSAVLVSNGRHKVLSTAHRVYGGCVLFIPSTRQV